MSDQKPTKLKGRKAVKYRGATCLNCETPLELTDAYCSHCGQLNTKKSLSLKDFFGEFVGSIITYDSKFRSTLKDLLFKPGTITKNYVEGKRLKYANPFRFFLSVSIIYFLLQGLISTITGENSFINNNENTNTKEYEIKRDGNNFTLVPKNTDSISVDSIIDQGKIKVDSIFQENGIELDSILSANGIDIDSTLLNTKDYNKEKVDSIIKNTANKILKKDTVQTYEPIAEKVLDTFSFVERHYNRFKLYRDFYKTTKIKDPVTALDSLNHTNTAYNRWAYQKNDLFEEVEKNPREVVSYLLEKTPFFVFFFTPFYALFFWLIYSKKKYTYMEHMIFIFHIFSFVFLTMLICLLPDTLIGSTVFSGILLTFIGPFYFYKALRNFYRQNRIITIIKFLFLNIVFWFSASIAAILFFSVTAALY